MRTSITTVSGIVAIVAVAAWPCAADVRTEEKSQVKFGGALGKVASLFGGKAAKEGIVSTLVVKGDRKLTRTDDRGQLVDLAEEKVYDIDFGDKSYTVITFAEMRRKLEEAQQKAKEQMGRAQGGQQQSSEPKKMAIDVISKETGEKKAVNGFDCRQVITTVTVHEEGKTVEEGGGMILTTDSWLTSTIAAMKESQAFDQRYFEKLSGIDATSAAQQVAAATAMFPALQEALGRVRTEGAKVEGTPIASTMTAESVKSPEQMTKSEGQQDSGGGLGGMLARKMMKKKEQPESGGGAANRANVMTTNHEVLSVATDVAPDAVALPAGFRQK
jgi:hypothetical protein